MANTTGKKYGGREAGTPNKLTSELKEILKNIVQDELEFFENNISSLDTKERIEILVKILPYILPKLEYEKATPLDNDVSIVVKYGE